MRFKLPNSSKIAKNKISFLFERIVRRSSNNNSSPYITEILTDLFNAFKNFFSKPKAPKLDFKPIIKGDVAYAEKYNEDSLDAIEDISICINEVNEIRPIIVGTHNSARQMGKELEHRTESALSRITDIRLFEGQLGQDVLIVGDDFLTSNKVDGSFALNAPSADIRISEGLVTLNRISSVNLVDQNVSVSCRPTLPEDIITTREPPRNQLQINFPGFPGSLSPDGLSVITDPNNLDQILQQYNIAQLNASQAGNPLGISLPAPGAPVNTQQGNNINLPGLGNMQLYSMAQAGGLSYGLTDIVPPSTNVNRYYEGNFYNFVDQARPEGGRWHLEERLYNLTEEIVDASSNVPINNDTTLGGYQAGAPLRLQDIFVYERGGTPEEKDVQRKKMFDGDSASFWEAEYVRDVEETIVGANSQIQDLELNELSFDLLREQVLLQDEKDFEVEILIDLGQNKPISWISLDPINFSESAWLEITDIATQTSGEEGFKTIPNLFKNAFANVLTNEANEELQADVAAAILAPDRYSFKGKGVFNFPTVLGQYIKIKVKQKVPVPNLYQCLVVQKSKVLDVTETITETDDGVWGTGFGSETNVTTRRSKTYMSKLIRFNYLQTVQINENNQNIEEMANTTLPSSSSTYEGHTEDLIFGDAENSVRTEIQDSGWSIERQWYETKYDKMRYAIGIRELSVFNYRFSPTSEFVSKKFTVPKEIIKAQLEVVEEIPPQFNPEMRYIEYYVSFDDETWHRINPTGSPTLYLEDGQIAPEIININFDVAGAGANQSVRSITTEEPATSARIKVVMKSDPSMGDSYSPVLKQYRLKLFPRNSLSRD